MFKNKYVVIAIFTLAIGIFLYMRFAADHTKKHLEKMIFAVSADYPPFEYYKQGKLVGLDIELAEMIAREMGRVAVFKDMSFKSILPAVSNGIVDAGIATITITDERKRNFDFSSPYYYEEMAVLFNIKNPLRTISAMRNKMIGCQLGSTMSIWLKKHKIPHIEWDATAQAISLLKSHKLDGILLDRVQAIVFQRKNPGLGFAVVAKSDNGYGLVFKQGSKLRDQVNKAIKNLKENGALQHLIDKYITQAYL